MVDLGAADPATPRQAHSRQVRLVINRRQAARDAVSSRVGVPCRNWQVGAGMTEARIDSVPGVLVRVPQ